MLTPILFGILFSLLRNFAFNSSDYWVYIHTRYDDKLFNLDRLRAKTKVTCVLLREMLFANYAALASHTNEGLQQLIDRFSKACNELENFKYLGSFEA